MSMSKSLFSFFFLTAIISCVYSPCLAQLVTITGSIRDSITDYTLAGVTVAAYSSHDSSLLDVQLTNNTGSFIITKSQKSEDIDLYVSFSGFQNYHKKIYLDSSQRSVNLGTIRLQRNYEQLDDVVIQIAPPISMNGDTLEINPSAFKMGNDVVVEDLLKKVSGVVVWGDGTVTVNGRKVDQVYVDGKPFISESARVVTQNLPKSAVEKIQVYAQKNDDLSSLTSDSFLTMNIKLRSDHQNGLLGKVGAGYGTSQKFDLSATGILFNRQSRLAFVGLANNINKKISGVQAALENSTYKNTNPNLSDAPDFEMNGLNSSRFYGVKFQHSFKPHKRIFLKNELQADISHFENKSDVNSEVTQASLINSAPQTMNSVASSQNHNDITIAAISYTKKNMTTGYFIGASVKALNNLNNGKDFDSQTIGGESASESKSLNTTNNHAREAKITGKYHYTDSKGLGIKSILLNYEISYDQNSAYRLIENQFQSFVSSIPDLFLHRKYNLENNTTKANFNLRYPGIKRLLLGNRDISGLEISLNNQFHTSNENLVQDVKEFDSTSHSFINNPNLTYNNGQDSIQYKPGLAIEKSFEKYLSGRLNRNIILSLNMQGDFLTLKNSSDIAKRNIYRSFRFFEPELSLFYSHENNKRKLQFQYKSYFQNIVPEIDQLYPVVDNINLYDIRQGNPSLMTEHILFNTLWAEYKFVKTNSRHNFITSVSTTYAYSSHAISDSIIYDEAGRKIVFPVNVAYRKNWMFDFHANYSVKLRESLLQVQYKGSLNQVILPGFINGQVNTSDYLRITNLLRISYVFSSLLDIEVHEEIYSNQVNISGGSQVSNLYNTGLALNLKPLTSLLFSNSISYLKSPSINTHSLLWNIYFTWRMLKNKRGELKLSGFDLLRNYKNIKTDIGYNFNSTTVNSGLHRFFMISFSYYPRYF